MTRRPMASVRAWSLALVLLLMVLAPGRAGADAGDEALLLDQLAAARAQNRLAALARSGDLDAIARRHAVRIAGAPHPSHNAALRAETAGWAAVGEVVGRIDAGPGWESRLQQLFLSSPTHRRVMLSSGFTMVGIGTARSASGVINAVEVFGRPGGVRPPRPPRAARTAPAPRPAAPKPPPAPPPPPTAPPPPPTTTTVPLSTLALAPTPGAPSPTAPTARRRVAALHDTDRASTLLAVGATAAELAVLGALVALASANPSRRGGRRRPSC